MKIIKVMSSKMSCGMSVSKQGYTPSTSSTSLNGMTDWSHSGEVMSMTSPSISSLMPEPRNDIDIMNISMLVPRKNGLIGSFTLRKRTAKNTNANTTQPTPKPPQT